MGKLAILEKNKRTLIEDNDMLNMKYKEALKVIYVQLCVCCVFHLRTFFNRKMRRVRHKLKW